MIIAPEGIVAVYETDEGELTTTEVIGFGSDCDALVLDRRGGSVALAAELPDFFALATRAEIAAEGSLERWVDALLEERLGRAPITTCAGTCHGDSA